ncbi:hypothetical protein [Candidatus Phytoplasma phoenicium]|uniref:Uncharacterized protein n=1 Tax=Candidatus Phytoplasma phoenicium TaxID=198422 RepID=A0A0L0MJG6_9MOLU|nr:hypothetical protein [Candidatus Phytoplasma phoenicium]KND62488.1 hypothetical protein AlmWB_03220 [Candidatus Phytoplasma phoenicium]
MKKLPFNFKNISMKHLFMVIIFYGLIMSLQNILSRYQQTDENHAVEIFRYIPFNKSLDNLGKIEKIQPIIDKSTSSLMLVVDFELPGGQKVIKKYRNVDAMTYQLIVEQMVKSIQKT